MGRSIREMLSLNNLNIFKTLEEKASTNTPRSQQSSFFVIRGLDGTVFAFRTVSLTELLRNYREIAPINTAIERIADSVAGLPLALKKKDSDELIFEHPFLDLLRHPNDDRQKTQCNYLHDLVFWNYMTGDAYTIARGPVIRQPLSVEVVSSTFVTPIRDQRGFAGRYTFSNSFKGEDFDRVEVAGRRARFIDKDNIAELYDIMRFNPEFDSNSLRGISAIESLFFEINQYLFSSRHNLGLLSNGARPSGVFTLKAKKDGSAALLSDEAYERLKNEIQTNYIGATNSGRPLILEGGMEWQQISVNSKDMDFKALKDDAEKQIYKNLNVPIEIIMAEGTTFSNRESARVQFYEDVILPLATDLFIHLDRFLLSRFSNSENLRLVTDLEKIPALLPRRMKRREVIEKSIVLTVNEKREELGRGPIEGGNKITDPNGRPIAGPDAKTTVQAFDDDKEGWEIKEDSEVNTEDKSEDEPEGL